MLSKEGVCLPSKRKLFSGLLQHTVNNEVFRLARLSFYENLLIRKETIVRCFHSPRNWRFFGEFFSVYPVCVRETPARGVKLENARYQWRTFRFRPRFSFRAAVVLPYEPVSIRTLYEPQMRNASKNPPAMQDVVRNNGLGPL